MTPTRANNTIPGRHNQTTMLNHQQKMIITRLNCQAHITPAEEIKQRIQFITDFLQHTGARSLVLGISGGQDSTLAGKLCQQAVDALNASSIPPHPSATPLHTPQPPYAFYAVRLPYGTQIDEDDAQRSLEFIQPTTTVTINIKEATDILACHTASALGIERLSDFTKGNIKARQRMIAQYAIAGQVGGLVVGTDHAAEAITGFYTKYGDGAADLLPLAGLNKRQGAQLLQYLGAPEETWKKIPTADLEDEQPALPDEQAIGISYHALDDYLEGKTPSQSVLTPHTIKAIEKKWALSEHKRHMPATPADTWWRKTCH